MAQKYSSAPFFLHNRVHADVVSHSTTDRALRAKPLLDVVCAPKGGGKGSEMERDKGGAIYGWQQSIQRKS